MSRGSYSVVSPGLGDRIHLEPRVLHKDGAFKMLVSREHASTCSQTIGQRGVAVRHLNDASVLDVLVYEY